MSINLNGTSLESNSNNLDISYSSNIYQRFTNAGNLRRSLAGGTPMFLAGDTRASWQTITSGSWFKLTFNTAAVNYRSCFSTSTSTFTAPETGAYYFTGSTYNYQESSSYFYPLFLVNSGWNRIGGNAYKPRGYYVSSGYSFDGDLGEIIYLSAGDSVYYGEYSASVTAYWYPAYSHFAGVYLG